MASKSVISKEMFAPSAVESPTRPLPRWHMWSVWAAAMFVTLVALVTAYFGGAAAVARWPGQQSIFLALNHAFAAQPNWFWATVTLFGDALVLMPLLALFLFRKPQVWAAALAAIPLGGLFSVVVKHWAAAPRPAAVLDNSIFNLIAPVLYSNSFPSGHTITAFAAASAVMITLTTKNTRLTRGNWACLTAALFLASMVGLSRIAVGAHWPIDVIAGAAGGWIAGLSGAALARHTKWWQWLFFGAGQNLTAVGLILWGLLLWLRPHSSTAYGVVLAVTGLCGAGVGLTLLITNIRARYRL